MNAHRTAIARRALSKPARRLQDEGRLLGWVLDYGCGRGGDVERLNCKGYDPHYSPKCPEGPFDTIMCNYVLNVIESDTERRDVLRNIDALLAHGGRAYITVRNKRKDLKGQTIAGTWQGLITLGLLVVYKCSEYVIYRMDKGGAFCSMREEVFNGNDND